MKVGIMQPYVFPYIGYFQLINHVDKWVVFDDTQYISKGWVNRNRILHPDIKKQWQYLTVPLKKHSRESRIQDIQINDNIQWRDEFLGKLTSYKKKAPFYKETREFVGDCLTHRFPTLSEWLVYTLRTTCEYLSIPFDYCVFSHMKINTDNVRHAGQWALEIADAINADEYVNPAAGHGIFNENDFSERNIQLRYLKPVLTPYVQRRGSFVPGLSIVDVMMWNENEIISAMLADYEIVTHSELEVCDHE